MAAEETLIIHKLVFGLQVSDKNAYKHFADRVSKLCDVRLPRELNEILRKFDIPDGRMIIHKLEINLGKISPHQFEEQIISGICDKLRSFLSVNLQEIKSDIQQSKFKYSRGSKFLIENRLFTFESDIIIPKSVLIERSIQELAATPFSLEKSIEEWRDVQRTDLKLAVKHSEQETIDEKFPIVPNLQEVIEENETIADHQAKPSAKDELVKTESAKPVQTDVSNEEIKAPKRKVSILKQIQALEVIPEDLPPKALTELDEAFLYYIRYGRLPSNVKYELGMRMQDIFNISQRDIRFFNEIKKHIGRDEKAKERLIRLTDEKNQQSLVRKDIFKKKEVEGFDPKIPESFKDYFVALFLDRDLSDFKPELRRYSLNDMIRFFYSDHPQKLKSMIIFLLTEADTDEDLKTRINVFFNKIGKASITKIIASFVRKAGYVNKILNSLNKISGKSVKDAHSSVLLALIERKDPLLQLKADGMDVSKLTGEGSELEIEPRVFLKVEEKFGFEELTKLELIDHFLTHGTLPHASSASIPSIERLSIIIRTLSHMEIKALPFFKDKKYEQKFDYQTMGSLSLPAIEHLLKTLAPNLSNDLLTKYRFFEHHLKSGVPQTFQKAFLLFYALRNRSISYLEEMVNYWKTEFGDADQVIKKRWKVSDEILPELNKIIFVKEESVEDLLKVDYEFQNYSKDISVKNAGLVILWPFLKVYFNMLDLLDPKGDFRSKTERARACHLLQYLAVKQSKGEELYFPLNKILTGYPLDEPLPYEITMTEKEIDVSNALLKNVIKQWNALKGGSVDALRGSFLIRDGVLVPAPNGWLLTVEKKAYDILMDKLPWGIGMIKLSWAPYVLSVEWERNIM